MASRTSANRKWRTEKKNVFTNLAGKSEDLWGLKERPQRVRDPFVEGRPRGKKQTGQTRRWWCESQWSHDVSSIREVGALFAPLHVMIVGPILKALKILFEKHYFTPIKAPLMSLNTNHPTATLTIDHERDARYEAVDCVGKQVTKKTSRSWRLIEI